MADPSVVLSCNALPLKKEEGEGEGEEPVLRPRPPFSKLPNMEEVDSKYKEIICSLPKEERWATSTMRQYKGFWELEEILPGVLAMEQAFKPLPTDMIVASFLKSGTTWLKALTFTLVHRHRFAVALPTHPLVQLNPHDCVPIMEHHYAFGDEQYLDTLPSPRLLGTHLSYSELPQSITTSQCPIVYICREPKDVLVSMWHMVSRFEWLQKSIPFNQAFQLFCEGRTPKGPIWDHVLEYYKQSLQKPHKVLFLKYEEMMNDPVDGVMRLASFLGCPFSEEEVKSGVVEAIVEFCSFKKLKDLDVNKNQEGNEKNHYFFRKGAVGDWQNHMTTEMATRLDAITKEKFHQSGINFGETSMEKQG